MAPAERANGTTAWSGRKDNLRYAWWGMEEAWRCFAGEDPLGSWKGSSIGNGWAGFASRKTSPTGAGDV